MSQVQQTASITAIRERPQDVLAALTKGPVTLTLRSQRVAVLVSPEQWVSIMELLEDQSDTIDAIRMELAIAEGEVEVKTFDAEKIRKFSDDDEHLSAD